MPRSRRILYDGATYHIVQRGHNKDILFKEVKDYKAFKRIMRRYKKRYSFDICHYCIMPNHFHILLKVLIGDDLPKIIHSISQSYSFYYKKRYDHAGYLYQNRYKSYIIENDSYLLECGRYIERNPVRAGIVADPSEYSWSSYNFYTKDYIDTLITADPLYITLGRTKAKRQKAYINYVTETRPYETLVDKVILR